MNLLIVEDDENNIDLFKSKLGGISSIQVTYAKSRDAALVAINNNSFDVVVLDLIIPTQDSALDKNINFGLQIHPVILEKVGYIPIFIFSGCDKVSVVKKFLEESERFDFFGSKTPVALVQYFEKGDFDRVLEAIKWAAEQLRILGEIEVSMGVTGAITLNSDEKRVLQIFARLYGGSRIRISNLGGGLSGARTFRVEVLDDESSIRSLAVSKIGTIDLLEGENTGYESHVRPILSAGCFPSVIQFIKAGAGHYGGLFYSLASGHVSCLSDVLKSDQARAIRIVDSLQSLLTPWHAGNVSTVTIQSIRRPLVADDVLDKHSGAFGFDWRGVDSLSVRIRKCPQHCDLHGLNVLLSDKDAPLLIDFGTVREAPSSLDAIIMELSLLFHPGYKDAWGTWPTVDQATHWDDLSIFTKGCPVEAFVARCRKWAGDVSGGDLGVFATAWAFALRQLKFPDTNPELAIAIANACARKLTN